MLKMKVVGYRVKSSSPKSYVQVTWGDEDRTVIDNAWSDTIKGPLLTKAEAYRVAAHWLDCGYFATVVRTMRSCDHPAEKTFDLGGHLCCECGASDV